MLTEQEINEAIEELEAAPSSYKGCEKLAVFYYLNDRLFGEKEPKARSQSDFIHSSGKSDFLKAVEGKSWVEVLPHVDELLVAVRALQPQLYEAFLKRF